MRAPGRALRVSADAWSARAVSLFEPGRNCAAVVEAPRASLLVDAEAYFRALRAALLEARESVLILGWDFNSRTRLEPDCASGPGDPPPLLGDFLNWLARRRRGLRIRVLIWDFPMVFGAAREMPPIYGFGWQPHRRVKVRYDNTHPVGGSQHQKIVVVDDALAFCGGIDLTARRWDSCAHKAQDERRTWEGKPYPPFHDVMAMVDGEAALALAEVARERWRAATGRAVAPAPRDRRAADPWPREVAPQMTGALAAVARTIPEGHPLGEAREVEALYLDMIAAAKDVIFIENQYFTSERLGEALARRLAEDDPPEIVVVTRLLSHGWLEASTMETLRTGLVRKLREADRKGRFGIYAPHVAGLEEGTCVDVHSKVTVIDDQWLRVGSANFSNRSMGLDTECDLAFEAGGDRAQRAAITEFRDTLIAEHLGVPVDEWRAALEAQGSFHAAIRRLRREDRTLRPLEDLPEPAPAVAALAAAGDPERPVSLDLLAAQFSSDDPVPARRGPAWGKLAAFLLVLVALAAAWRYTPLSEYASAERIRGLAAAARGTWWAPLAVVLAYVPATFVMFPRPLLTIFAVVALGPWAGFAAALSGVALAGACLYVLGRTMKRDTVRRIAGERLNRTAKLLRRRGLSASFACSIAPVAPFIAVGVVAGAMRVKLWEYLAGMLAGMLPGAAAATLFADQLAAALEHPDRINWWIVAAVVAAFGALAFFARRWLKRLET